MSRPDTGDTLARCLDVLFQISHRRMTAYELADEMGVHERTIVRDLARWRRAGVKIQKMAGDTYKVDREWWKEQLDLVYRRR